MRLHRPFATLLFCLAPLVAAADEFQDNLRECTAFDSTPSAAVRACTWVLDSQQVAKGLAPGPDTTQRYARVYYQRARSYDELARAHRRRGKQDRAKANHERAIADYTTIISRYPLQSGPLSTASVLRRRGWAHQDADDLDSAIADFSESIRRQKLHEPRRHVAYVARALAYRDKGDYSEAISDLEMARVIEPTSSRIVVHIAWTYYQAGNPRQAVESAQQALKVNNMSEDAADVLGHALVALGDTQQAMLQFQRAMLLGGGDQIWLYQRKLSEHGYKVDTSKKYNLATYQALKACVQAGCRLRR